MFTYLPKLVMNKIYNSKMVKLTNYTLEKVNGDPISVVQQDIK